VICQAGVRLIAEAPRQTLSPPGSRWRFLLRSLSRWPTSTRAITNPLKRPRQGYRITLICEVALLGAVLPRGSIVIAAKLLLAMARALITPHSGMDLRISREDSNPEAPRHRHVHNFLGAGF
jgi:hypothetical protein